jgi:hypothetical protein
LKGFAHGGEGGGLSCGLQLVLGVMA